MSRITKDQLVKLQKKLKTDGAIGEQFGITRQAVHQLRQKFGIKSVIVDNPARNNEIKKLHGKGISTAALAKKYNLSVSHIYHLIYKAKPKASKKKR